MNLNQNNTYDNKLSFDEKRKLLKEFSNTINQNSKFNNGAAKVAEILTDIKPKSNKDSRSLIIKFLEDIDVEALSAVFILAGTIITSTVKIYRNMRKLNENTPIIKFEPLDEFNINSDTLKNLFESEEFNDLDDNLKNEFKTEIIDKNMQTVLDNENYQFKFESGHFMETINGNKLATIPFSLKYHKDNTKNLDEFINSVGNFLKTTDTELTENDIKRLKIHYEKY